MPVSDLLEQILGGLAADLRRGQGPVKWCRRCGRKHPTRQWCGLVQVTVPAKSGRMVERQVHASRAEP